MSTTCDTGACEVDTSGQGRGGSCGSTSSGCPCGTAGCSGDPIDCAAGMWTCAFFAAMKQAQVDILKSKIQKAWGAKMDKAADAVVAAMGTQWQSMLAQAHAKTQLRDTLQGLWQEASK